MHKAEHPNNYFSNSFTHNQAEQIKIGVIFVQILLEIHLTEYSRFHFQGWTTSFTYLSWSQKCSICTVDVGIPAYPCIV